MKTIIFKTVLILFAIIMFYLIGVFLALDFNICNWYIFHNLFGRIIAVVLGLGLIVLIIDIITSNEFEID